MSLPVTDRRNHFQTSRQMKQNEDMGSYASNFAEEMSKAQRRQNQVINYKPYTLKDYRQLKKEIQVLSKVGGLGPDLDSRHVREMAEKQQRRLKYSQFVEEVNRQQLENQEGTPRPPPPTDEMIRRQKVGNFLFFYLSLF